MKKEWVQEERHREIRQAADAWHRAGAIDGKTVSTLCALYPESRRQLATLWRVLIFFFVSITILGIFGAFAVATDARTTTLSGASFVLGVLLVFAAESQRTSLHGSATGADGATAFWGVLFLLIALSLSTALGKVTWTFCLFAGSFLWALASWRWGYPVYAVFSACFFFLFLGRFEHGRALWLLASTALVLVSVRHLDRASLAPSHRLAAGGILAVSLVAAYAAINRFSLDRRTIELVADWNPSPAGPSSLAKLLSALGTIAVPLIMLIWGLRSRRTLVLDLGFVFTALSLTTLRYYVRLAPLWAILATSGAVLVCVAILLNRFLSRSPGRQCGGFTAEPLFGGEERQKALQAVAFAAGFAPKAAPPTATQRDGFSGGGGTFGGGGSSGTF